MKHEEKLATLLLEIEQFFTDHAQVLLAAQCARFFKEGYDAYGIPEKLLHEKAQQWSQAHADLGLQGFLDLGDRLWQSGMYEEGSLAILFIIPFRREVDWKTFVRLGNWLSSGVRNWAHTDLLCGELLSHCLVNEIVPLQALASWRASSSKWKRRAVPVSMLGLLKTGEGIDTLLEFIRPLMLDDERVVQQGLGWFLKEAWKKYPKPVEKFLLEWKDSAPHLIFQYASEKMSPEKRARFRVEKRKPVAGAKAFDIV
ncbi:DNA alkylation repair protein [bacterium]|nr:DNA alkylation repair protein [bacterium]